MLNWWCVRIVLPICFILCTVIPFLAILCFYCSFSSWCCIWNRGNNPLPNYPYPVKFGISAGYLDVKMFEQLYFIFAEHETNPKSAPLIVWLGGKKNCSSLTYFLSEPGPFRLDESGNLSENFYSWNKLANILFMEISPTSGFSYTDKWLSENFHFSALHYYHALKDFFRKFPEYQNHDIYLMGEDYAIVRIAHLSQILRSKSKISYKGFAIGSGSFESFGDCKAEPNLAYYQGLIDSKKFQHLLNCCAKARKVRKSLSCRGQSNRIQFLPLSLITRKKLYLEKLKLSTHRKEKRCTKSAYKPLYRPSDCPDSPRSDLLSELLRQKVNIFNIDRKCSLRSSDVPCYDTDHFQAYFNKPNVKKALNVSFDSKAWKVCESPVPLGINDLRSEEPLIRRALLDNVKGLIYNGNLDLFSNFLVTQSFVESLQLKVTEKHRPWFVDGQLSGFVSKYGDKLTVALVRQAGHHVAADRPSVTFKLIESFLYNKPF